MLYSSKSHHKNRLNKSSQKQYKKNIVKNNYHKKTRTLSITSQKRIFSNNASITQDGNKIPIYEEKSILPQFPSAQLSVLDLSCMFSPITKKPTITNISTFSQLSTAQQDIVKQLCRAEEYSGFFYITGIPLHNIVRDLQDITLRYLSLPLNIKKKSKATEARRGYHRFLGRPDDTLESTYHEQTNITDRNNDTTNSNSDYIEAFTMQSVNYSDKQLQSMIHDTDDDENHDKHSNNYNTSIPSGIFLPPHILKMLNEQNTNTSELNDSSSSHTQTSTQCDTNNWPKTLDKEFDEKFQQIYKDYWIAAKDAASVVTTLLCLGQNIDPSIVLNKHKHDNHTLESKLYPILSQKMIRDDTNDTNNSVVSAKTVANTANTTNNNSSSTNFTQLHDFVNPDEILNTSDLRFPVHSDLSTVTLLTQTHDMGGLLVALRPDTNSNELTNQPKPSLQWRKIVTPINFSHQDLTLVNIGDFFTHYTSGKLHSSPHCVTNTASPYGSKDSNGNNITPRLSTVFFYMPDMQSTVEDLINVDNPKFKPYLAGEKMPLL